MPEGSGDGSDEFQRKKPSAHASDAGKVNSRCRKSDKLDLDLGS